MGRNNPNYSRRPIVESVWSPSVSLRRLSAQLVVSSSRSISTTPPLLLLRPSCPPNTTRPLQISSAVTTVLAGRSARALLVSSSKVYIFLRLFPVLFSSLNPFFSRQGRTSSTPKPSPSNSSVHIRLRCTPVLPFTVLTQLPLGTPKGRSPPAERRMPLVSHTRWLQSVQYSPHPVPSNPPSHPP